MGVAGHLVGRRVGLQVVDAGGETIPGLAERPAPGISKIPDGLLSGRRGRGWFRAAVLRCGVVWTNDLLSPVCGARAARAVEERAGVWVNLPAWHPFRSAASPVWGWFVFRVLGLVFAFFRFFENLGGPPHQR